jgi:hypothetical protein
VRLLFLSLWLSSRKMVADEVIGVAPLSNLILEKGIQAHDLPVVCNGLRRPCQLFPS